MTTAEELHGDRHVERYLETDGEDGFGWRNGTKILILFTTGRKSGEERSHALIFEDWADAHIVVASKGGTDAPPAWFLNLEAEPHAEIQIKADRVAVRARVATDDEKPQMWAKMVAAWPDYDDYQKKTDRVIPVVVLDRV